MIEAYTAKQINKIIKHLLILFKQPILKQILSKLNITFSFQQKKIIFHTLLSRDLTSRPHIAGLPEDLDSAKVIEERWKNDGLQVTNQNTMFFSHIQMIIILIG